jgi:hypothetical protein
MYAFLVSTYLHSRKIKGTLLCDLPSYYNFCTSVRISYSFGFLKLITPKASGGDAFKTFQLTLLTGIGPIATQVTFFVKKLCGPRWINAV